VAALNKKAYQNSHDFTSHETINITVRLVFDTDYDRTY